MLDTNEPPKHSYGYAQYGYRDLMEGMKMALIIQCRKLQGNIFVSRGEFFFLLRQKASLILVMAIPVSGFVLKRANL
jgi:hypothetical protein